MNLDQDRMIVHIPIPVTDAGATVRLVEQVDQLLRTVRSVVCSGWCGGGDRQRQPPQPHLTAWLDVDAALVLTELRPRHALLELHLSARSAG